MSSARDAENKARRSSGLRASNAARVLTKKTRGAKSRTLDIDAKKKKSITAAASAKLRKLAKDPEWRAARGRKIAEGIARAKKEREDRATNNVFSKLNRGKNFLPVAIAYAEEAVADKKGARYGVWIRLAAKRFLHDLSQAGKKGAPFVFDQTKANRACRFIENLPHVEGKWKSPTITLVPAQAFFVVALFGFRLPGGGRRFTDALYAVARKNAKSTLAAAIMLYILCEEDEPGAQLFAAATTGDQARVVWRIAKAMLRRCPDLQKYYRIEPRANDIVRWETDSFFKPINAKASTQDGLNPMACALDEIHAHKTHDLLNVLTSAAGARLDPLFLFTTTEGYETPGPWPEMRAFAQNVLRGSVEADHYLALIYALDDDDKELGTKADDDFDESRWCKANPLYDTSEPLRVALKKGAIEAQAMPGKRGEFRIKRLNRRSSSAKSWIDIAKWRKCNGPVDLEAMAGHPCWAAFDLASTTDMVAWALIWLVDGVWHVFVRYFVPRDQAKERAMRRSAPYEGWIEAGHVVATEGDVIDYRVVEAAIREDIGMFQPVKIAYDPWNAQQIVTNLAEDNIELEIFIQGPKSYHPAMQALEVAYMRGNIRHGDHPVLLWNAGNLVPRYDVNMNMAPDRKRSADKIDGMCAVLMALGIAIIDTGDDSMGFFDDPVVS